MHKPRIAIFQYNWPLQSYSKDIAIILSENGFQVDFFLYDESGDDLVDTKDLIEAGVDLLRFHEKNEFNGILGKLYWRFLVYFSSKIIHATQIATSRHILFHSWVKLRRRSYNYFIGIEKQGLNWAGIFGDYANTRTIYYSLELYIEDHPHINRFKYLREQEKHYHAMSDATIIQDHFRERALQLANGVVNRTFHIPVSVRGDAVKEKSYLLHEKLGIDKTKKIALFFGGMAPQRFCEEIIRNYENNENYILAFHGYELEAGYLNKLKELAGDKNVYFSTNKVSEKELPRLLRSAHVGFAIYSNENKNDRYTAFSSQKIAIFCRCGIPFVSNDNEAFRALKNVYNCTVLIEEPAKIHDATLEILGNHDTYQEEAYRAYESLYQLDSHISPLLSYLRLQDG